MRCKILFDASCVLAALGSSRGGSFRLLNLIKKSKHTLFLSEISVEEVKRHLGIINSTKRELLELIDKYIVYNKNKGKVYVALNEARSVYEEFVTISDADILFFDGWERAVFNIFENHKKAGVVSPYPCPYTTFYLNKSVFSWNTIFKKIKYAKFVSDEDIDLYVKGTNLPKIIDRNSKFNWKEKQFILKEKI